MNYLEGRGLENKIKQNKTKQKQKQNKLVVTQLKLT